MNSDMPYSIENGRIFGILIDNSYLCTCLRKAH